MQYKVVRAASTAEIEPYLNQVGAQGWRLREIFTTVDLGTTEHFYIVTEREADGQ